MDELNREIINHLQGGFPLSDRPFALLADRLDASESELITRIRSMLDDGVLTRFGPLYNIDRMGGTLTLCAMHVPIAQFEQVAATVNQFQEVAHNYQREHHLNMWFVLAAESRDTIDHTIDSIESLTNLKVLDFPKQREFHVNLRFKV